MNVDATTPIVHLTATTHFPIKLTANNFPVWKCQVQSALIGLGLDGYLTGTTAVPELFIGADKSQVNPAYQVWYRQAKMLLSALLGSCSDTIQPTISSAVTAKHAWDKLAATFASASRGRIISLKTALSRTTKGSNSITTYLAEMQGLADALALAQNPISDEDLVINILNGLGPEYNEIASAIRVRDSPLPLAELQDILLEFETRKQAQNKDVEALIPSVNATRVTPRQTYSDRPYAPAYERRTPATRRGRGSYGGSPLPRSTSTVVCKFCDHVGHDTKVCRKLQRFLRENNIVPPSPPAVHHTTANTTAAAPQWLWRCFHCQHHCQHH
ncbi:unnamed protein product [Cuscuta epithymum]|uniref:Retrotransposon Copia-like N-terminal domain-containing protein n=1 Tax=Cuscuta epithymum TaxID=186058 RepID=A0AAV0FV50_9ASTE|nr:unnamed protein product [Cuscuta epithymum]